MPDSRRHRGAHPQDAALFAEECWPVLRKAVRHLSWLLTRDYAMPSALKLVGDRFQLDRRQRLAVMRSSCSDQARSNRRQRRLAGRELARHPVWIDGFNFLLTIEAGLAGGVLLEGRDGCLRDLAGMHGSYRRVEETAAALALCGTLLNGEYRAPDVCWWLDRPVSNSGRLAELIERTGREQGWCWQTRLEQNPDARLAAAEAVVVSADAAVLDRCRRWCNLAAELIRRDVPAAWIVPLG